MPSTLSAAPPGTLGTAPGPLALRIHGTERDGQTVRLQSAKIAIGSGSYCTLRLQAAAIAPVHCLILRGQKHTVIRRWNLDTRLNGAGFEDSLLKTGDRLAVGPIELEVLANEERAPIEVQPISEGSSPSAATNGSDERAEAEALEIAKQRSDLAGATLDLRKKSDQLIVDREELAKRAHSLAEQSNEFNRRLAELASDQSAWNQAKQQQEATLRDETAALKNREAELLARADELQTQAATLELQKFEQDGQATKFSDQTAALAQRDAQIGALQTELANRPTQVVASPDPASEQAKADLDAARREFETAQQTAKTEAERRAAELDARQAKADEALQSLAKEQEALKQQQAELAGSKSEFERLQRELATERTEHTAQQARAADELAGQKAQLQKERTDWEALAAQNSAELDRRAAEIDELVKQLAAEQQKFMDDRAKLAEEHAALVEQQTSFAGEQAAFAAEREQFEKERTEAQAAVNQISEPKAVVNEEATLQPEVEDVEPQSVNQPPAESSPEDSDDVFARLRALSLLKSDSEAASPAESTGDSNDNAGPNRRKNDSSDLAPEAPRRKDDPAPTSGDDESIDDYMVRLLERMRGLSGEATTSAKDSTKGRKSAGVPEPSPTSAEEQPTADQQRKRRPFTMEPRKSAPERSRDLAAMREIANESARSAIATHQHRSGANRALGSLAVGVLGLVCGIWLLVVAPDFESPFFYGGLTGLVVGGYWFIRSGFMARHVRQSKNHRKQQLEAIANEQKVAKQEPAEAVETEVAQ